MCSRGKLTSQSDRSNKYLPHRTNQWSGQTIEEQKDRRDQATTIGISRRSDTAHGSRYVVLETQSAPRDSLTTVVVKAFGQSDKDRLVDLSG